MPEAKKTTKPSRSTLLVLAGAGTGLLVYLYYKRRQAAASQAGLISTLPSSMPAGADNSSTNTGTGAGAAGGGAPAFNSLQDWMSHVQVWANSVGFDAATVQSALQAYSLGNCVDSVGYKVIDQALGLFGQPPSAPYQGVVLCQPTAPPTTTPTPPTPQDQLYAGTGSANASTWLPKLWQAGDIPANTIPVYGSLGSAGGAAKIVGYIPFGTLINPTGPVATSLWGPSGGTVHLIPVGGGRYVGTADVGQPSPSTGTVYHPPATASATSPPGIGGMFVGSNLLALAQRGL